MWDALANDFGFLLQDHYADPEREPPGECCRTQNAHPASSKPWLGSAAECSRADPELQ
jgi:hypothetical protein